jgi:hypothetical protein
MKAVAITCGWREGGVVLVMVLSPIGFAVVLVVLGVLSIAGWQMARGAPIALPTPASIRLYGMLAYAAGCWIAVAAVWLWSSRQGIRGEIFLFRRLTWSALAASIAGFVLATYGAPVMTHWLSQATGGRGPQVGFHDTKSVVIYVLLFVATTPVCEEILYRGLLVVWLRRAGWSDSAIWPVGSLIFGANHAIPLGLVWAVVMVGLGAILFAIRLRHASLTPAWLAHFLFNAQPLLIYG